MHFSLGLMMTESHSLVHGFDEDVIPLSSTLVMDKQGAYPQLGARQVYKMSLSIAHGQNGRAQYRHHPGSHRVVLRHSRPGRCAQYSSARQPSSPGRPIAGP